MELNCQIKSLAPQQFNSFTRMFFLRTAKKSCKCISTGQSIMWWKPHFNMGRVKRIWYLSPMRAAKVQASLRIRAVSPEPPLLAHTSNESRGTFRQKARSLAPLNGWACAVKCFHDRMLEDTNCLTRPIYLEFVSLGQLWSCRDSQLT